VAMTSKKAPTFKLDIFKILKRLNSGDTNIWATLTEDERKGFTPYIITQWMFGTTNRTRIIYLNEIVNPQIWALQKHPELLCKLLAICGLNDQQKLKWIPLSQKKTTMVILKGRQNQI
jgi:hypothetical protein